MQNKSLILSLAAALAIAGCDDSTGPATREVSIAIQQSLTGENTAAGTFTLSGGKDDAGSTTETITFGGPLNAPTVPLTFVRVLSGERGRMRVVGSAVLTWTSETVGTLAGSWEIDEATGEYSTGSGTLSGTANFGVTPPTASLTYVGRLQR